MTRTPGNWRRVHIIQGEAKVDTDPDVVMTTLLGSCVAACIRDPGAGVGGMNHFLLPGDMNAGAQTQSESYGLYLMELLVNGLLKKGARRHALEAKLFGGARTVDGLSDIGAKNGAFAKRFLEMEGIAYVGGDLGGDQGRRIEYWPHSGRARQILMEKTVAAPRRPVAPAPAFRPAPMPAGGDLELF
ncbi:putative chemoreceptor glutamine deamidase CheD [Aureimonas endophytica]|uniref:Probable chemoreceptor glutamine deamidase CheD n=1 Tax=Aureimonas endophytica TaxID=2027858 RepID=A0A917EBT8_9HYPH|nr:chemotaxis protein CheD [Aureimonas endophytica]GGE17878.1 putative chemoreceptor glutamine deamidase CheD [Aureimonas endophytica]